METKEIKVLINMSIRYLEMVRNEDFNSIIKDIKGARKYIESRV